VRLSDPHRSSQATAICFLRQASLRDWWRQTRLARSSTIYEWVDFLWQDDSIIPADTISANLLTRILRAAINEGASRPSLMAAIGIDEARLRNPLSRLSSVFALRTFATLERQFSDPAISLRIGEKAAMQNFSDLGYGTRLCANLGAVIETNIRLQILRQNMFKTVFESATKPPKLRWETPAGKVLAYAPLIEFSVATFARLSRQILGEPPLLRRVDFQHPARFNAERYQAIFGCPVYFSMPETSMEMAARQLFRPSPHANAVLFAAAAERYKNPAKWMASGLHNTAFSYFYLSNEIDKSPPTLDRMASSFGTTERSLRRKLVEEGHPFRELLEQVRQDLCALYFMEDKRPLGEIAFLLGYSDLSAFTRAYKRWYGVPPSMA
jgi:AraC-like DNA-binding protein